MLPTFHAYRSYIYGDGVDVAFTAEGWVRGAGIFVTGIVRQELARTPWASRLTPVEQSLPKRLGAVGIYQLA